MNPDMNTPPIEFVHRGQVVSLRNVPPTRTLLELLREDLHLTATKEGCGEGDCGACTVVLGQAVDGRIQYRAVNACIRLAHSIDGMALWTAQDLVAADGSLHPVQEAMVQCHGSQCGFCTPGFVMSLFDLYQNQVGQGQAVTRAAAQQALAGNLCRCTGYRPILQAAQTMAELPVVRVDEALVLRKLERIREHQKGLEVDSTYLAPRTLAQLLSLRSRYPKVQVVAGCTDVGLWVTKLHMEFAQLLDVTRVQELRRVEVYPHHVAIGAAVPLAEAFDALVQERAQLRAFALRFAGPSVRNSGTLGGNVANGSPIGDSMPLLIALGANVVMMSARGHREMGLEQLYTGYRKNVMAEDEVLAWIKVPRPTAGELSRIYKISKRFEDDISAVCLGLNLKMEDGVVRQASIGVGGVAATPVRALRTQAALLGQPWSQDTVQRAIDTLRGEFTPISDMRASAAYRTEVLGSLLRRFWLESQGGAGAVSLESLELEASPS